MSNHQIKYYEDGFKLVEFCSKCGAEGLDLFNPCTYIGKLTCIDCGHLKHVDEDCSHCKQFRKRNKKAIDKYYSRN